jgi:hypothetical protein
VDKSREGERVTNHERLQVRAPPLRGAIADLPVAVPAVRSPVGFDRDRLDARFGGREPVVESLLEPGDLVFARMEVVAGSEWEGKKGQYRLKAKRMRPWIEAKGRRGTR